MPIFSVAGENQSTENVKEICCVEPTPAATEEPPRSVKQEITGTASNDDIEARLDRLAESF